MFQAVHTHIYSSGFCGTKFSKKQKFFQKLSF